jgi:hypothetical protein
MDAAPPIVSRLHEPSQRFLARTLEYGFTIGFRGPEEFLERFGAKELMLALAEQPTRRARLLEVTVGLRPRIAMRKSPESAAEDLQIALDEGETDAATILQLFEPDDRVQFLDNQKLWGFIIEPRFWVSPEAEQLEPVRNYTIFALDAAIDEGLLTPADIVNAISVPTLIEKVPADGIAGLLERALMEGRNGTPFTDEKLIEVLGLAALVSYVPLSSLWEWVLNAKVAARNNLLADGDLLFDESEAHPDASGEPPPEVFADEPKTAEL